MSKLPAEMDVQDPIDISHLTNLTFLAMNAGPEITNKDISGLRTLFFGPHSTVTDRGLSRLTNLTQLSLRDTDKISDFGLVTLTALTSLNLPDRSQYLPI